MNNGESMQDLQKIGLISKKNNLQNEKKKEKIESWLKKPKVQLTRNILSHSVELLLVILLGTLVIFFTFRLLINDPWTVGIMIDYTLEAKLKYLEEQRVLHGWYDPYFVQYFTYLKNFFSGKWGKTITTIYHDYNSKIIFETIPRTIQLFFLAFLFSIIPIIVFGKISGSKPGSKIDHIILTFTAVFFVLPTGGIGMLFQFIFSNKLNWFGKYGSLSYQNVGYNSDITGFILIDSLIKGDFSIFLDVLNHLIMPSFVISLGITAVGILIVRWFIISKKNPSFSYPSRNYKSIALIFFYFSLILSINEEIFYLYGFFNLIFVAITYYDFYLIINSLTLLFTFFQLIVFLSEITGIIFQYNKMKKNGENSIENQNFSCFKLQNKVNNLDNNLSSINKKSINITENPEKNHLQFIYKTLVNNFEFIFGSLLLITIIIITYFAESYYNQNLFIEIKFEAIPWSAPSFEHPLGTSRFGFDVLGLTLYGFVFPITRILPIAIIVGFAGILIGLFLMARFPILIRIFNYIEKVCILIPLIFIIFNGWAPNEIPFLQNDFNEILCHIIFAFILGLIAGKGIACQTTKWDLKFNSFFMHLKNSTPILLFYLFIIAFLMIMFDFILGFKRPYYKLVSWGLTIYYGRWTENFYNLPWTVFSPMIAYYILIIALIMICLSFFKFVNPKFNNNQLFKQKDNNDQLNKQKNNNDELNKQKNNNDELNKQKDNNDQLNKQKDNNDQLNKQKDNNDQLNKQKNNNDQLNKQKDYNDQ